MHLKNIIIAILIFFCSTNLQAQQNKKEKDSARMYKNIEAYSKKRKFTKFLHGLIFEPVQPKKAAVTKKREVKKKKLRSYEGKIIRSINIVVLDPFGYSEKNTTDEPTKAMSKIGNKIHIRSSQLTIRNLLLFRRNRPVDSLLVRESERLVRSQRYVRAVAITPEFIKNSPDSVDINIRVLDSWSLIPDLAISSNSGRFDLTERNFLGTGHQVENRYNREFDTGNDAYSIRYSIPNIRNTYIRTTLNYQLDLDRDYSKSINVERQFFSPFTRWAGGVLFEQQFFRDSLPDANNMYAIQPFKVNTKDFWGGASFVIMPGNSESDRTTNLIATLRNLNVNYTESPTAAYDSINFYSAEKFWLAGIGISSRQFIEDKFIFNYGITEDVPVGKTFGITFGWQDKNDVGRLYFGGRVAAGRFFDFGYLSSNLEYGTFFNQSRMEQNAFTAQVNYFTNLLESGKWKFRQFVKTRFVLGLHRQQTIGDQLVLDERNGIPGFHNTREYGTSKALLTLQTQAYSPWNFGGFRLNPYFSYSIGILGDEESGFTKNKAYSQIGLGFIISNDYLVFSTFQLSIAYYPSVPGSGENIFRTNAFNTQDFGFQSFEFSKPRTVNYE